MACGSFRATKFSPRPAIKNDVDYACYRVRGPLAIDGRLSEAAWQRAARSPRFVDMVTGQPAFFDTRAAALWDDDHLYVGFWIGEPFVVDVA